MRRWFDQKNKRCKHKSREERRGYYGEEWTEAMRTIGNQGTRPSSCTWCRRWGFEGSEDGRQATAVVGGRVRWQAAEGVSRSGAAELAARRQASSGIASTGLLAPPSLCVPGHGPSMSQQPCLVSVPRESPAARGSARRRLSPAICPLPTPSNTIRVCLPTLACLGHDIVS